MAFPTLGLLDQFNRADEDPLAGGWAGPIFSGERQLRISTNEAAPHSVDAYGNSYWNTSSIGPDLEAYCTLTSSFAAGERVYFYFRATVGATVNGYSCRFSNDAGDHHVWVYKDGVSINDFDIADTVASGDKFGVEMIGDTITAYWKAGAGAWTSLGTTVDSTYTAANYIGLALVGSGVRVDDFGGGTLGGVSRTINLLL